MAEACGKTCEIFLVFLIKSLLTFVFFSDNISCNRSFTRKWKRTSDREEVLHDKNIQIVSELVESNFENLLAEHQVTCLLLNFPINDRDIGSTYLGTESMSVNLPANCNLNQHEQLSFKMLKGKTILSPSPIGFWSKIYQEEIPDSKIIFQNESSEYSEILQYSFLPFFTTNLTSLDSKWGHNLPDNRSVRPLKDEVAHQKFYACYLKHNKDRVQPLIEKLQDQWSKYDQK